MKRLVLISYFFLIALTAFAQKSQTVDLIDEKETKAIGEKTKAIGEMIDFLEDSTGKLSIEDLQKIENQEKFTVNTRKILHFKKSKIMNKETVLQKKNCWKFCRKTKTYL
ncbi:MAG: hypothetical protein EAZ97_15380 [Bacteroidetes bacterium]|nr:MAG: hypothetical protein EAZ97_15380 [Bacteroidota bacterium]